MAGVEDRPGRRFGGAGTLIPTDGRSSRTGERERLRSLAGFRVLETGPEPEFDGIARLAARIGSAEGAVVTFLDDIRESVKAAIGLELPDAPRALSFGGRLIERAAPLVVEDALCDPLASSYPWVADDPGVRFYAGVPLRAGGLVVGTLALVDRKPRAASDELLASLLDAADVLLPHLQRRREEAMAQNLTAVHDFEGRFMRVSAAFETVLGWTPADMVGRPVLDFVHPDDVDRTRARLAVLKTGQASGGAFECRYRCREGGHRWLMWTSDVAPHEGRIYSAGKDITDRKRQETALRESEARYRLLAENATDMIAGHDLNGLNTYVSSAAYTLTGYSPDELVGGSAYGLIHPADHEPLRSAHAQLLENGRPQRLTCRLRRKDGTWLWVETIARLVRDERSRPTGIQSASRDITEAKHAVEALEAAREHFRRAFDDAPIGMAIVDREGFFDRVNAPLCELLGYTEDELIGKINPLDLIHPEDRGGEEDGLAELLSGGRRTFAIEKRLMHKAGHAVWARITTSVMRGGPDSEARLLTHVEDVSERRRNAEDLLRAREAAERANHAKSEFLSRMSHELRTPLNAVLGFAQLLDGEPETTDDQRESVGRIMRGGYHLLNLVNDVLDISAIESGRLPIPTEAVPAGALVHEAMDLMRGLADERSIRVRCDLPGDEVVVDANAQRLKQVLLNLVANAIKYSAPGAEVAITVERACEMRARIHVSDTGPGIPPEQLERAFAPFERLGARRDVEGTGLGLPLSRNLVQALAGTLTAESGPGGSTFTVDLPQAASAATGDPRLVHRAATSGDGTAGRPRRRVLYIEDNASNVELLDQLVSGREDLELHAASRGDAGIELARRIRPDVVVLDLHLPDTTGEAVLAQLRAGDETADVPVIVVTADVTGDHEQRLLATGASAYMTKPLDLGRFAAALDRALARAAGSSR
jgi:PAS domain S-box-containing protein